jgi:hypothetical protein
VLNYVHQVFILCGLNLSAAGGQGYTAPNNKYRGGRVVSSNRSPSEYVSSSTVLYKTGAWLSVRAHQTVEEKFFWAEARIGLTEKPKKLVL